MKELSLQHDLTEENVKRLLRWKDPRRLTEEILSGPNQGHPNKRVRKVLEHLADLNAFRHARTGEDAFRPIVEGIFLEGLIWQVFLFHLARPYAFPMIDQHVFRAFAVITRITKPTAPKNWDEYVSYRDFFFALAQAAGIIHERPQGYEDNPSEITGELKKVDDALFAFGQFLNRYNPSSSKADNASSLATN